MSASLHIYLQLIQVTFLFGLWFEKDWFHHMTPPTCFPLLQENPEGYKDLTASFVAILKQVVGGKLPMDFNYHSVPSPWVQMQLLRILSLLGKNDQR